MRYGGRCAVDNFALLVTALGENFPYPVHVDLPHKFELKELPTIGLFSAGPAERRPGLNVLGVDVEDIDLHFFVSPEMMRSGEAMKRAAILRIFLARVRADSTRVLDVTRPEIMLDRNPRVKRIGLTVSIASPIDESNFL
ncbi:hypothetical protein I6J72_05465 [Corynebacterium sp. FDAARGOS 1242]|uniref:Uncharacterized protein n=1 Tax=Corynebacterium minutissimum TaxID=38301 RepID=A0A376CY41_9CORY|nr:MULTISPECIES: hypothetical protein [Corynebacterium]QRP60874.1 hypothetical protein I6J26_12125 [Corynebacterium minutissimum]QRP98949.1 hypothetical protein I6J72_05465 [Corynebacterium sp. FDAARGOS 1242]STC77522.1 Uncharacterised protein [Corynebacterium minutissimum]